MNKQTSKCFKAVITDVTLIEWNEILQGIDGLEYSCWSGEWTNYWCGQTSTSVFLFYDKENTVSYVEKQLRLSKSVCKDLKYTVERYLWSSKKPGDYFTAKYGFGGYQEWSRTADHTPKYRTCTPNDNRSHDVSVDTFQILPVDIVNVTNWNSIHDEIIFPMRMLSDANWMTAGGIPSKREIALDLLSSGYLPI